jgi:hypothetical protein
MTAVVTYLCCSEGGISQQQNMTKTCSSTTSNRPKLEWKRVLVLLELDSIELELDSHVLQRAWKVVGKQHNREENEERE